MKQFLNKTIFISILVLATLISVNYFGDAARLFSVGYEKKIADIVLTGSNATNISNYDERLFQKELITRMMYSPEVVILGSSRTMLINKDYFIKNQYVFNNSVSGASIEDLIAIYQLYKSNNLLPKRIFIGIDPWTFNENNGQQRWKSLSNEYNDFIGLNNIEKSTLFKYSELISPSYFQSSIKNLQKRNSEPESTITKYNKTNTKFSDGSISYGQQYRLASGKEIDAKANNYISGRIYGITHFYKISNRIQNNFFNLINDMIDEGIDISLVLVPYHPIVFEVIKDKYSIVLNTEQELKKFAVRKNISIYGSYDPKMLNFDNSFFYDGMHCNENGIKAIMDIEKR